MRDFVFDPEAKNCYANCSSSASIFSYERDPESGKLKLLQIIKDDEGPATLLDGVHSSWINPDGSRLYAISGRFGGESGLTLFGRTESGELKFLSELKIDPNIFRGGNDLVVTQDERLIVVSGTTGSSIVLISRDPETNQLER